MLGATAWLFGFDSLRGRRPASLKEPPMVRMKPMLVQMLVVALAGCAPYALAVKETYNVATDPRSLATQATDT
jgi:hypothetical protein